MDEKTQLLKIIESTITRDRRNIRALREFALRLNELSDPEVEAKEDEDEEEDDEIAEAIRPQHQNVQRPKADQDVMDWMKRLNDTKL